MHYTEEQLNQIQKLAGELTPATEIGVLLDINEQELLYDINDPDSLAHRAFFLGFATTANEMRRQDIDWAKAGSPVAAVKMSDYIRDILSELKK